MTIFCRQTEDSILEGIDPEMFLSMKFPLTHATVVLFNTPFSDNNFLSGDPKTSYSITVAFFFSWAKPKYYLHIHPPYHGLSHTSFLKASLHLLTV